MIRATDQPDRSHELFTEGEAVKFLRLDTIGIKRPDLSLRRYRTARGGYALKTVRICGRTLYRREDLRDFVESLQRQQDLSEHLTGRKGVGR